MMSAVIALGGSLLRPEIEERHKWLEDISRVIKSRSERDLRIGIVVGGGSPAREGINLIRPIIEDLESLDHVGIAATRLNATIIREVFLRAGISVNTTIPKDIDEAVDIFDKNSVLVMGGTIPGHTTDAVAIRLAIRYGASKCIIATNVKKVFDEDPKLNPNAKSYNLMSLEELKRIVGPAEHSKAGYSQVVDPIGVDDALRNGLTLNVLDGRDAELIGKSLDGEDFQGTVIHG
ncbi:MAG: UMP kinase [Euryarchaeota archaeon]|nr:UMP kinase [Euryarchaeota archaeon]